MIKKKIKIDLGHGAGKAHNRGSVISNEGDNNYFFGMVLKNELEKRGFIVSTTRDKITDTPGLDKRGQSAKGYDLFLSLHSNASGDSSVRGTEIFPDTNPIKNWHGLAANLSAAIAKACNTRNRGVIYWGRTTGYQQNRTTPPKSSNYFAVLRYNLVSSYAMLVEHVYHTNYADCKAYVEERQKIAVAMADTIADWYGVKVTGKEETPTFATNKGTPILSVPTTSVKEMQAWAKSKGADPLFVELAQKFYDISKEYGVNPAVTYAQSAKETAYMKFGGVLDKSFCNPCGLKTTQGGGNYDKNAHTRFKDWHTGIEAQVQHLGLYAGDKYDKSKVVDPRHFDSIRGVAKTVEALGGKWAPSANYGSDIVAMMKQFGSIVVLETVKRDVPLSDFDTVISLISEADIESAMEIANRHRGVITFSGDIDYSGFAKFGKMIVAIGGDKNSHTGYATHFISGKNRTETYNLTRKFSREGKATRDQFIAPKRK